MSCLAELLSSLPERETLVRSVDSQTAEALLYHWPFWARPEQLPPPGDWSIWLVLGGRGMGKTRTGAETIRAWMCGDTPLSAGRYKRAALVAETAADARDVMVEGPSGVLGVHPPSHRPRYEPSKRRLTWPNGAIATLYNATEPDQLRGPQHDCAWLDELGKWRYADQTWDMLQFGLRLGDRPRQIITTTPRPTPLIKRLMRDPNAVVTRGETWRNAANLAQPFLEQIRQRYGGTRLGRQELEGEILDDIPGSLWTRQNLDQHRRSQKNLPQMTRIVVAIDPAARQNEAPEDGAETGIVVVGLGEDGRAYVLDDASCRLSPTGWARRAIAAYDLHSADCVVVEVNQGGDMVETVLRTERPNLPVRKVHATRGKTTRAEPVAALYEQGRVSHVGAFPTLEDQMVCMTPYGIEGQTTADRVDALVWALTELFPRIVRRQDHAQVLDTPVIPIRGRGDGWLG